MICPVCRTRNPFQSPAESCRTCGYRVPPPGGWSSENLPDAPPAGRGPRRRPSPDLLPAGMETA